MDNKNIKKALQCCIEFRPCNECPLNGCTFESECRYKLMKLAYELVQRQDEQIEVLIAGQEILQEYIKTLKQNENETRGN